MLTSPFWTSLSSKVVTPLLNRSIATLTSLARRSANSCSNSSSRLYASLASTHAPTMAPTLKVTSRSLISSTKHLYVAPVTGAGNLSRFRWYATERELQKEANASVTPVNRKIGAWLTTVTGMVFGIVVVGGVTRLTESGLSIVEWKPITGTIPPIGEEEWAEEFEKYKQYPEFKRLQPNMTLAEFQNIFWWEWAHRVMGRVIGVAFAAPFAYLVMNKLMSRGQTIHYSGLLAFGSLQGALGWYMVKSGLEVSEHDVPRVSPYRLAAHLGTAFLLYMGLHWGAMNALRPSIAITQPIPKWIKAAAGGVTGLTFLTALSGAFVAGLDAGLCYNEFPYMGDGFIPEEYWRRSPAWKNFTENSPAVQFNHRVLGLTTFTAANLIWLFARNKPLPRPTRMAINATAAMAWLQATLGISTLLYFVPLPLAAAHQAGSLTLLTFSTWILHTVMRRKPIKM